MGLSFLKLISPEGWAGIVVSLALSILLGIQVVKTHQADARASTNWSLYQAEKVAHQQTIINYQRAAEVARQKDAANKARVEAEQAAINQKRDATYEARIADARAHAERLRQQLEAAANPRGAGAASVPGVPAPPVGAHEAPGKDGLSLDDQLTATEQAIQLDEIIKWIDAQHAIDVQGKQ